MCFVVAAFVRVGLMTQLAIGPYLLYKMGNVLVAGSSKPLDRTSYRIVAAVSYLSIGPYLLSTVIVYHTSFENAIFEMNEVHKKILFETEKISPF